MLRLDGIVFTIINLIVLYLILRHFLIGPVKAIMQQREELIAKQFSNVKAKENQADDLKKQYEVLMRDAKEESAKILESAKTKANGEYEAKLREAEEKAARVIEKAHETTQMEKDKVVRDVQAQIADLALAAAGKVIRDESVASRNKSIYDDFIEKAGEADDTDRD